jgi:tetratricopeptide (TPR) repeat protein
VTSDFIALHEAAHLWSNIYNERWLYEGFADWTAQKAAEELGLAPSVSTPDLDRVTPPEGGLQLISWTEVNCPPIRCPESREFDLYGYARSLAFVALLEESVGAEALMEANARVADDGDPVGARGFMDALEETTGQTLDAEFLEWVYTSEDAPLLQQRRQARDQLTALMSAINGTDLVLPSSIAAFIEAWEFEQALQLMPRAAEVIPTYNEARTAAEEDRNIWQRVGLLGDDPDDNVDAARSAFAEGRFEDAGENAEQALEVLEDSESEGKRRVMVAAGLACALLVGGLALLWLLGRHRVRRSPYHV